jgi:hypothetical protein
MPIAAVWGDGISSAASLLWNLVQRLNRAIPDRPFQPRWAPAPLIKQAERTFPQLGFPRETDSLCPQCVIDVRERIVTGDASWRVLVDERPGEIRARIVERDNRVYMEKTCPAHGTWSDVMAIDADGTSRLPPTRSTTTAPRRSSTAAARS